MKHFNDHIKYAVKSLEITPTKIKDFLNYLSLSDEEISLLKEIDLKINEIPDKVIDSFYKHILSFPEIKKVFKEDIEINNLKTKHKKYLKQILNGEYNFDYVISRIAIGYTHAKEGIPSNYYIGAYGKYSEEILKFIKNYIPTNKTDSLMTAIFKIFLFDLAFSVESYFLKKQELIEEINKKYKTILDASNDAILIINAQNFRIVDFNKKLKDMVGLTEKELLNLNAVKISPKILWKKYLREIEKVKNQKSFFFPNILIENKKTKTFIPCEINASSFEFQGSSYIIAIFRDIRKRKSLESEIERINRLYSVLSKVNLSINRHSTVEEIFQETVKIIVDYGKFKTACISEVNLKEKKIIPKYIYGDTKYFENVKFPLTDKLFIESISYLEDEVIVIKDVNQLPEECKWKERIKKAGFNSAIVTPIYKTSDREKMNIKWILSIYSNEIKHFEEKEISLIKEISFDLSFAVERIREKLKFKYFYVFNELTNLSNRNSFLKKVNSTTKSKKEKFSIIVIDIDKFKAINDTFGYLFGDLVLKKVSQKLKELISEKDEIARIGSDEFGIILFTEDKKEEILKFLKNLETEFSHPLKISNEEIFISFSIGIANFPEDGKTAEEIITNAETALSKAKKIEDSFCFYSQELNEKTHEIFELEKDLRLAIKNDEFEIFYQPKIEIKRNKIIGAEALLRWKRKGKEIISPDKFIPVMEETGLINKVGSIVLEKVCRQISEWKKDGIFINVAVNISAVQLRTDDFLNQTLNTIKNKNGISSYVEFEITETALMENIENVNLLFKELEKYNVKFSIDDFGTGYSSLVYLKKLPVYALKIDREFIKDIPQNKDDLTIAKTIIDLAENLNKETIAEGVETEEQLKVLEKMGCRIAQGYYFSKPIPAEEFKNFYLTFEENGYKNSENNTHGHFS